MRYVELYEILKQIQYYNGFGYVYLPFLYCFYEQFFFFLFKTK